MFYYSDILSRKAILFYSLLALLLFGISSNNCYSLIEITYTDFGYTIGPKGEPVLGCEISATLDGLPIELTTNNTKIIQSKSAFITNITIDPPNPEGKQTFTWGLEIGLPHNVEFEIIVTSAQEIGSVALPGLPEFNGYNAAFYHVDDRERRTMLQRQDFTEDNNALTPDNLQYVYLTVAGDITDKSPISSRPWVDSITFSSPLFSYVCWPRKPAVQPPPSIVDYNCLYRIDITYDEPAGHPYMREWMIVHFGGGIKYRFELFAHEFDIPNQPQLKLLYPNGGESFAPCEEVLIQWEGHHPGYHTRLEFSSDSAQTWQLIEIVPGDSSSYLWTVPETISDNCYISIRQTGTAPQAAPFGYDQGKIHSAVFDEINNDIASKLLTASSMNNIVEWDLFGGAYIQNINTIHTEDTTIITSAIYTDKDKIVALDSRNKELLFYNSGNNTLQKNVKLTNLPDAYKPFTLQCDPKQRFILIEPEKEYGNTILFTDTSGNYITALTENTAFTDIYISEVDDKIYYSLIDNTIKSISLANFPNLSDVEVFDFAKDYNIVNALSVSNDGNMIGITARKPAPKNKSATLTQQTDNVIFDKRIGKIYKNLKVNISTGLDICFSPASTIAIVASSELTQIVAWDLTINELVPWPINPINVIHGLTVSKTGNTMVARSEGAENTVLMTFVMPEFDKNDAAFSITIPELAFADSSLMQLKDLLIGTTDTNHLEMQLCNKGLSKIEITQSYFEGNTFELEPGIIQYPLILLPGECTTINIIAHPSDTGLITNKLVFKDICDYNYEIPISIYSINRTFALAKDTVDFGTVCLFDSVTFSNIALFTNEDSIEVEINSIASNSPYFIVQAYSQDTILQPGESYVVSLIFIPGSFNGDYVSSFTVFYEDQRNVTFNVPAKATVIGADIVASHPTLPFIPEEPIRTVTFTNNTEVEVIIDSITIMPPGLYAFSANLPQTLMPGDTLEVSVECLSPNNIQYATLILHSSPCSGQRSNVALLPYAGTAYLEIPNLQAGPTDNDFTIPINFKQTENHPYNGMRPFEATIAFNSTLFYPKNATSKYGEPEIISNNVVGNQRIITLKLIGNFTETQGVLLNLHGIVMLGNAPQTDIIWNSSKFFSTAVAVAAKDGSLQLIGLCEDRLVNIAPNANLQLDNITPLPAKSIITVNYQIQEGANPPAECLLEIYNLAGTPVLQKNINSHTGKHSETIDITSLVNGNYLLTLRYGKQTVSLMLIKAE